MIAEVREQGGEAHRGVVQHHDGVSAGVREIRITSVVYFADDGAGRIKIGVTRNLHARKRSLSHEASALTLLGTIAGDRHTERAIHLHLSEHRLEGEWFADCGPVREVIATVLEHGLSFLNLKNSAPSSTDEHYAELIADEARQIVADAMQPVQPGENIKKQLERAWVALGKPPFWRIRAAWYGEAGKWLGMTLEDFRARDRVRRGQN
jgi:T5orf172 domain